MDIDAWLASAFFFRNLFEHAPRLRWSKKNRLMNFENLKICMRNNVSQYVEFMKKANGEIGSIRTSIDKNKKKVKVTFCDSYLTYGYPVSLREKWKIEIREFGFDLSFEDFIYSRRKSR